MVTEKGRNVKMLNIPGVHNPDMSWWQPWIKLGVSRYIISLNVLFLYPSTNCQMFKFKTIQFTNWQSAPLWQLVEFVCYFNKMSTELQIWWFQPECFSWCSWSCFNVSLRVYPAGNHATESPLVFIITQDLFSWFKEIWSCVVYSLPFTSCLSIYSVVQWEAVGYIKKLQVHCNVL